MTSRLTLVSHQAALFRSKEKNYELIDKQKLNASLCCTILSLDMARKKTPKSTPSLFFHLSSPEHLNQIVGRLEKEPTQPLKESFVRGWSEKSFENLIGHDEISHLLSR